MDILNKYIDNKKVLSDVLKFQTLFRIDLRNNLQGPSAINTTGTTSHKA